MSVHPKTRSTILACTALLLLFGVLSYSAAWTKSPTCDEPLHAAAGYVERWCGDYRVDIEDPALFPMLSTLPQSRGDLFADRNDPTFAQILKEHTKQANFIVQMMFRTPRQEITSMGQVGTYDGPAYIDRARLVFTCIAIAAGAVLAWWAYQLAGSLAAIIATALFALDPSFLGHGSLVKNDVPIAMLMLWLMCALWLFGQRATWIRWIVLAAACAIAVNIKFSGILLIPMLAIVLLIRSIMPAPWSAFGRELKTRGTRLLLSGIVCITVIAISWATIWIVYRCRYSVAPDVEATFDPRPLVVYANAAEMIAADRAHQHPTTQAAIDHAPSLKTRAILWLDDHRLLPHAWTMGLFYTYITTLRRDAFLIGQYSETGWGYYFPLAMLFKTPLAVLVLAVVLSARIIARKFSLTVSPWTICCIGIPIALYGFSALRSNLNIGLRHVLPIYPFTYLLMAIALANWIKLGGRLPRVIAGVLFAGLALETLLAWPNYIAFFNVASGGERGGITLLGDSNLDWNQDLPLVAAWQQQHPDKLLYLSFNGATDPKYYGIRYVNVGGGYGFSDQPPEPMDRPGVFAIGATNLQGIYYSPANRDRMKFVQSRKPLAVLGGSIYLFDWNPDEFRAQVQPSDKP